MGDVIKFLLCGASLALGAGAAASPSAAAELTVGAKLYGDVTRGETIAGRWCASCHAVKGPPLNDQAPSFASLAASDRSEAAIRGFLMQPHPPMPPLALANQEIEDILAFLNSLKTAK